MAQFKEISRGQIEVLLKDRLRQRQISRWLKVSQSTVSKTIKRTNELKSYQSRKRSGRPRATSTQCDRVMHRYCLNNPFASSSKIKANLPPETQLPARSIRRRLSKEFNLPSFKAAKKPLLSAKNKEDRRRSCEKYSWWTASDWHKCMFSDESKICLFISNKKTVRRPPGKRFHDKYTVKTVRNCSSVMIWGAFCAKGRWGLHFV